MKRERGCLGSLSATTRDLLGLRAGLDGPPLSRAEAAAQLGLTRRSAARIERTGLRELHVVCGGGSSAPAAAGGSSGNGASARLVSLASDAPALQPAGTLVDATTSSEPRGSGDVKGVTSTSPSPQEDGTGPVSAAASSSPLTADVAQGGVRPLLIAAVLALLAALMLVALRRRAVMRHAGGQSATAATWAPATAPAATPSAGITRATATAPAPTAAAIATDAPPAASSAAPEIPEDAAPVRTAAATETSRPQPSSSGWAGPSADAGKTAVRPTPAAPQDSTRERLVRSASAVAVGAVSFAVRELRRRRSRR